MQLVARGAAPSGASTGSNEALELREKDNKERYLGKGVLQAVENVSTKLSEALSGQSLDDLAALDKIICDTDGTELKTVLGGNAVTATSFAIAQAGANMAGVELFEYFATAFYGGEAPSYSLPTPLVNILNGGKHAGGKLKIQEFMIVPKKGVLFKEALRMVATVYHHLGKLLVAEYGQSAKNLGDEGGFAPQLDTAEEALNIIETAIETAGFKVGEDMFMALDCAASEFYDGETGKYEINEGEFMTANEVVQFYVEMVDKHPALISIEDGLDEKDYEGWIELTKKLGDKIMLVGDDLYTTNTNLISQGIKESWCNALLLKVNQIGTISESMEAARLIYGSSGQVLVSHRSGETTYTSIADLAVGIGAGYIKTGATARGERVGKYNRLLQIEELLLERGLLSQ
eukprot:TRINITY_DN409_c0_g1_i3.p1 TRINITY_DN409_c0_g1~~TRINITY_DN409_c0_g1_i3.p1  ORF type:complete len:403 (-),score=172.99 TRINITY_DN409_c0_g1_i3:18-1226(-)